MAGRGKHLEIRANPGGDWLDNFGTNGGNGRQIDPHHPLDQLLRDGLAIVLTGISAPIIWLTIGCP